MKNRIVKSLLIFMTIASTCFAFIGCSEKGKLSSQSLGRGVQPVYTERTEDEYVQTQQLDAETSTAEPESEPVIAKAEDFQYSIGSAGCIIKKYIGTDTNIIIPDEIAGSPVIAIANYAFQNCTSLTGVVLPDSITELGYYIFDGCTGITKINVPKSLEKCGYETYDIIYGPFENAGIKEMIIPDGLTVLPDYLFYDCSLLESVEIPDSISERTINADTFKGCTSLKKVVLPGKITSIGGSTFSGHTQLTEVELGEGLKSIGTLAFSNCTSLKEVVLPDSITELGYYIFDGCTGITKINVPKSLEKCGYETYDIIYGPFENAGIKEMIIPEGLTVLPDYLFCNCNLLESVEIPDSISERTINADTFKGCISLKKVVLPGKITSIDSSTFSGLTQLEEVKLGEGLKSIGTWAFNGCSSLQRMILPEGLETIGEYAFANCTNLSVVRVPETTTTIYENSFQNCPNVTVYCYSNSAAHTVLQGTSVNYFVWDGHEHDYVSTILTEPTCATYGLQLLTCTECGYNYTQRMNFSAHTFSTQVFLPNCSTQGYTLYTCDLCDYNYKDDYVSSVPHTYGEWVIEKEATIFETGVKSRVCSACNHVDRVAIERVEVDVEENENYGRVAFKVVHAQTLDPIQNAQIFVSTDEGERTFFTDVHGEATFALPVGMATVSFLAKGCLTRNLEFQIKPGFNEFANVGLSELSTYDVEIKSEIMTMDEIVAAGIDTSDPANQHVVKYELKLNFEAEIDLPSIMSFFNGNGECIGVYPSIPGLPGGGGENDDNLNVPGEPIYSLHYHVVTGGFWHTWCKTEEVKEGQTVLLSYEPDRNDKDYVFDGWYSDVNLTKKISVVEIKNLYTNVYGRFIYVGTGTEQKASDLFEGIKLPLNNGETLTIYPASENFYLIIRGEVRWLKEMFDVEMLIVNNSLTDTMEDLTATLVLPEGLSLAAMIEEEQSLSQYVDYIAGGESKSLHWYVRGDTAGQYDLKATLTGKVMPFEEKIDDVFVGKDKLQVFAGDALHLNFSFPSATYHGEDFPITITLTNVSNVTLYNVQHLIQVSEGMEIYYSNGDEKKRIETSAWQKVGIKEMNPGDKIIIETTANIIFKSEVIEHKIQKYVETIEKLEGLWNMYNSVNDFKDVFENVTNYAKLGKKALDVYIQSTDISRTALQTAEVVVNSMAMLSSAMSNNSDNIALVANKSVWSWITATYNAISNDPLKWVLEHSAEDIDGIICISSELANAIKNYGRDCYTGEFNAFESIKVALEAIPVRFVIESVVMTESADSTTRIPWSYTATEPSVRYFGVSNASKYMISLVSALVGTTLEDIDGMNIGVANAIRDALDTDEAIRYIKATEKEIEKFKVSDSTGKITFRAWVERNETERISLCSRSQDDFILSCDNKNAVYENGILTFTGGGMLSLMPNTVKDCTLHIEDSEGNHYTYAIDVVEQHECVMGERKTLISPDVDYDGVAVHCCVTCSEIMQISTLYANDMCEQHHFAAWEIVSEPTCTEAGVRAHTCTECGYIERETIEAMGHDCEGNVCRVCGQEIIVEDCDCSCHKKGFWEFLWRILNFFYKLFQVNPACKCGIKHY